MMMKKSLIYLSLLGLVCISRPAFAQDVDSLEVNIQQKDRKAWEIGVGASVSSFSRVDFTNFKKAGDQYKLDMQLRHSVIGPHLYIARELSKHFYLDVQGNVGFTEQYVDGKDKLKTVFMVGPGLQWRLGEYWGSKYVDPFLRVGVNYMKKDFDMKYTGTEGLLPEEMSWVLENLYNKDGKDRNEMFPIALGVGMNAWLSDRFGIGIQGDWLMMPHKNVANSTQGTVRLMWRIGGKSKKAAPHVQYVERVVQAPPVTIEKIVEVPAVATGITALCELFNNIYFEFDRADIRPESNETLDRIADMLNADINKKYLVTGYTDAKGSAQYNLSLSRRRAAAVIDALQSRGVPDEILKSRGVGKKVSYAPAEESDIIREGDRKVTVEIVTNMDYWNYLPKKDI